jgi:flagellar export protein FliJ
VRRFTFSLADLYKLREFKARQAEITLAAKTGAVNLLEQNLKRLAEERVRTYAERGGGVSITELMDGERYLARLEKEKERTLEELAAAELERQKALAEYQEALKQRKVLEELREIELKAYKKERERQETITMDDIVTGGRSRRLLQSIPAEERA